MPGQEPHPAGQPPCSLVFLLDVDNTLIDNDRLRDLLALDIETAVGPEGARRFWVIYEEVREELDVIDFPTIIERLRAGGTDEASAAELERALLSFPFDHCVFPGALEAIAHLATLGTPAVTSDGDAWYQPAKVRGSGIEEAVAGRVLIVPHKEQHYGALEQRYPADRYVVVDDKPHILEGARRHFGHRAVTIWVRQGKYARRQPEGFRPDCEIQAVAELARLTAAELCRDA